MITLTIDDKQVSVREGATILEAADAAGVRIPRLCHHPKLGSPGSCRICAVEVAGEQGLLMACREPAREGMAVRTDSETVRRAREDVLEFMLANHPLDCPVCDASGECDLQDLYVEYSRRPSRFREQKAAKAKAVRAAPEIMLDAERCIACTRCIRFLEDVAGSRDLGLFGRGERTEIGVAPGTELTSLYAHCTVDLCPVGALTSADFRFQKRAWMLEARPTICTGCARGCNAWLDVAGGRAFRLRPRENDAVNGPWMCDAGRLTYKAIEDPGRPRAPLVRAGGEAREASWEEATENVAALVRGSRAEVVCLLSAGASLEENVAVLALAREALGARRIFFSCSPSDPAFEDDFLRRADRDPNLAGVLCIASERPAGLEKQMGYLVLSEPHPDDVLAMVGARPAWVVQLTSSGGARGRWADVVLPLPTHFEQPGSFVNCGGRLERAAPAIEARGQALPAWEIARRIAHALGKAWEMDSAEASLAWGGRELAGVRALLGAGAEEKA